MSEDVRTTIALVLLLIICAGGLGGFICLLLVLFGRLQFKPKSPDGGRYRMHSAFAQPPRRVEAVIMIDSRRIRELVERADGVIEAFERERSRKTIEDVATKIKD